MAQGSTITCRYSRLLHWQISHSHQSQGDDIISAIIENGLVGLVMLRQYGALLLSVVYWMNLINAFCKKR